ncbi:MAG: FecR domain-containing protein [Ignavibacteria bacterium]|nr:FecR domain-containing protein [Ignavibacteria bacterium]
MNEEINKENICGEIELLIDEQIEGMISLSDKQKMEIHIADCPGCKEYLKKTLETLYNLDKLNSKYGSLQKSDQENIWENVSDKINFSEHSDKIISQNENTANTYTIFRKKYVWISGIAAVIAILFIFYAVKNWDFRQGNDSLQYSFGLPTYWKVVSVKGSPKINDMNMVSSDSIKEGQWITTDSVSIAELIIADIGKVTIEPDSKVILVKGADSTRQIFVEYGMVNTETQNGDNRAFKVGIPSAVAENKGGSYSLKIDKNGDGMIVVKSGKVDVLSTNKNAIVPAGNIVMTKNGLGVGTPFNEQSSPGFKNALFNYDFGNCNDACMNIIIDNAKMTDAVSLINILNGSKAVNETKEEIYNKVANLIPPRAPVHKDSLEFFDEKELEIWIDDIQKKIETDLKGSLERLEENLSKYKDDMEKFYFDSAKFYFLPENFDFTEIPEVPEVPEDYENYKFKYSSDSAYFNSEEMKKEMEKMKKEIDESNKFNKEELDREMEQMDKELKELNKKLKENIYFNNEEFKKEMERVKEEMKRSVKEYKFNEKYKFNEDDNKDNTDYNSKDTENSDIPEAPKEPDIPPDGENK